MYFYLKQLPILWNRINNVTLLLWRKAILTGSVVFWNHLFQILLFCIMSYDGAKGLKYFGQEEWIIFFNRKCWNLWFNFHTYWSMTLKGTCLLWNGISSPHSFYPMSAGSKVCYFSMPCSFWLVSVLKVWNYKFFSWWHTKLNSLEEIIVHFVALYTYTYMWFCFFVL